MIFTKELIHSDGVSWVFTPGLNGLSGDIMVNTKYFSWFLVCRQFSEIFVMLPTTGNYWLPQALRQLFTEQIT